MTWRINLIGFIAAVVWLAAIAVAQAPDYDDSGVAQTPDYDDIGVAAVRGCDPCDINCDGFIDAFDIEPFLGLLFDPNAVPCSPCAGDVTGGGSVDAFDIFPFLGCLFAPGSGGGTGAGGAGVPGLRIFFDTSGNAGSDAAPHPGSGTLSYGSPILPAGGGRLYIYGEFQADNQTILSPNFDITIEGGTITGAWNYNGPGQDTLTGDQRWDLAVPNPVIIPGGNSVAFTAANLTHMGLKNGIFADNFDFQHDNTRAFGDTLLGYIDVEAAGVASIWLTVGRQGFALLGGGPDTPISFGYGDAAVRAYDIGVRTQLADATIAIVSANSLTTLFTGTNRGAPGGGVYFDVTVGANPIQIVSFQVNSAAAAGTNIAFEAYTHAGGASGFENSPDGWVLETTGSGSAAGRGIPTPVTLNAPFALPANTTVGMALTLGLEADHAYANGNGANQHYADANVALDLGQANNSIFGAGLFSPRVWNGTITYNVIVPPQATCQDVAVFADSACQANVTPQMVDAGSAVDPSCTPLTFDLMPPGPYVLGDTPVTLTVTDGCGQSDSCMATITVIDNTAPILVCAGINSVRSADPGACDFTMPDAGFDPVATDNCPGVTLTNDFNNTASLAGETFPVGVTPVVWTATDAASLTDTCTVNVTITDDGDGDGDGVIDCLDNCPAAANADQADDNGDGVGDACEAAPAGQPLCGCGLGLDGVMFLPMMLLGMGIMRRRRSHR